MRHELVMPGFLDMATSIKKTDRTKSIFHPSWGLTFKSRRLAGEDSSLRISPEQGGRGQNQCELERVRKNQESGSRKMGRKGNLRPYSLSE